MGRYRTGIVIMVVLALFLFGWWFLNVPQQTEPNVSYYPTVQGELVEHTYYALDYNEQYEQPYWVGYLLSQSHVLGTAKRRDNFCDDPSVKTESAQLSDYKQSGFDRGHLCPAADMKLNQQAMNETFFLSNMSPQQPSFNRGKWKELEEQVRKWVLQDDSLWVVTGPIFLDSIGFIGANQVGIPSHYFKVLFDLTGEKRMLAFVMPNLKLNEPLEKYVVPTDSVEVLTGIDFFPILEDSTENALEQQKVFWENLPVKRGGIQPSAKEATKEISYGCLAKTKKGKPCSRKAQVGSKYCWQHTK